MRVMETFFCQNCGENAANLWVTKITEGQISKQHLCEECFRKLSGYSLPFTIALPMNIMNPFLSLTDNLKPVKTAKFHVCKSCSTSWSDFLQSGSLGCPQCYQSFQKYLKPIIEDIHSSLTYKGKVPKRLPDEVRIQASLQQLKQKLFKSIDKENYEEAALIRDQIKELKKQLIPTIEDVKK